jgi:hypothetical protein
MAGEAVGLAFEGFFRAAKHAAFGIDFDLPSTWSQGLRRSVDFDLDANLRQFDADINLRGADVDVNLRGTDIDPYTAMFGSMDANGRVRTVRRSNAEAGISLLKRRAWYASMPVDEGPMGRATNRAGRAGLLDQWIRTRGQLQSGAGGRNPFPKTASPNSLLFSTHDGTVSGNIQRYMVYNQVGDPVRRIDVVGPAHGPIPTPHTLEWEFQIDPSTGARYGPFPNKKKTRASDPWEIP